MRSLFTTLLASLLYSVHDNGQFWGSPQAQSGHNSRPFLLKILDLLVPHKLTESKTNHFTRISVALSLQSANTNESKYVYIIPIINKK